MAILTTRATAATVSTLTTRTRRMLQDTSATTGNQRWSDSDIRAALDDSIAQLYSAWRDLNPGPHMASTNLSIAADAETTALPSGLEANAIYRVEDITESSVPIYLDYRDPIDIDRFQDAVGWTLLGNALALRPKPGSAKTLRLWYLAWYIPISGAATPSTDQHALPVDHEELIALGAAIRLQENDGEVSSTRMERFHSLWDAYLRSCDRVRGPVYVRNTRISL